MKIVVQGNCQSRPVTTILSSTCPQIDVLTPVVTQLQTDADKDKDYRAFEEADLIFSQWVSDTYHVKHLATSTLKSEFGSKVISWPNAFFIGQNPDVVTISTNTAQRIIGPLDTYHIRSVYRAWLSKKSVAECVSAIEKSNASDGRIVESIEYSLNELKKREAILDISISDYIEANWLNKKLFHVFNHPTNDLLIELVNRLCDFASLENRVPVSAEFWPESLARVIAPGMPAINDEIGIKFETSTSSKGFALNISSDVGISLGDVTIHSLEQLVACYYKAYDSQMIRGEEYMFTPRYLHEDYNIYKAA